MPDEKEQPDPYVSQVDSLFAAAWNKVHDPSYGKTSEEGDGEGSDAAGSAPTGAAPGEGVSAATAAALAARARGEDLPTAGDPGLGGDTDATGDSSAGDAGAAESTGAQPDAEGDLRGAGVGDLESAEAVKLFAPARKAAQDRFDQSFRQASIKEIQETIDPGFVTIAQTPAIRLVGKTVPDLRPDSPDDAKVQLLDRTQAENYQKDLIAMIEADVADKVKEKQQALQPTMTVINESYLMFENNPDLIPGTKDFDPELAAIFVEQAKSYELKVNGKVIGYQDVNVQPLINSIRATLARQRGATGAQAAAARQAAQRAAAAAQPRAEDGKFDSPQAGVLSKAGMSGDGGEDYNTFWEASGVKPRGTLGI